MNDFTNQPSKKRNIIVIINVALVALIIYFGYYGAIKNIVSAMVPFSIFALVYCIFLAIIVIQLEKYRD